jgi:hypothetical protein
MKRIGCIIVIICAAWVASTTAVAQTSTKEPAYHPKNEVTITGRVASVKTIPDWMGKDGVNLALESSDSALVASHVDVATAGFLSMFDFPLAVGDDLKLRGCWSQSTDGTQVFLVHELTRKKVTINVRDPGGKPLW